jgi:hypothetical protein
MKFLLAIAFLMPALAQAAPSTQTIQGEDALRLWAALKSESAEGEAKKFNSAALSIECSRSKAECIVSLNRAEEGKQTYLYRDGEAQELYENLNLEEFEGRLGFTKIFASLDSSFEILCSRFFGAEGETFSCTIDLG